MMWAYGFLLSFVLTGSAESDSGVQITPPAVAVRYGDTLSANCSTSASQVSKMGWECPYGGINLDKVSSVAYKVDKVTAWRMNPICFVTLSNNQQSIKKLQVIVYQMPKIVSLSGPASEMVEGQKYTLKCDLVDVAPVNLLSVLWYKGKQLFYNQTFSSDAEGAVNQSSQVNLTANRGDDGTQIWCEATLNLKPAVDDPLKKKSNLNIMSVLYPPTFSLAANETLNVSPDEPIVLNCTAGGNPAPVYSWYFSYGSQNLTQEENDSIYTGSPQGSGIYSCTASNRRGRSIKYFIVTEESRPLTTFGAILGGFLVLGVLIAVIGLVYVKQNGSFSCNRQGPGVL